MSLKGALTFTKMSFSSTDHWFHCSDLVKTAASMFDGGGSSISSNATDDKFCSRTNCTDAATEQYHTGRLDSNLNCF